MRHWVLSLVGGVLCTVVAGAQVSTPDAALSNAKAKLQGASPVAFVYVSSMVGNSASAEIVGFSADPTGRLTPIPGSPFPADVGALAGNGKFVFGSSLSTTDIESYAIDPNGALHFAATTSVVTPPGGCGNAGALSTDHSGTTLYDVAHFGSGCLKTAYETFSINNSNGNLTFLDFAGSNERIQNPLTFSADNQFAYTTNCAPSESDILSFRRSKNGKLVKLSETAFPILSIGWYCGLGQAADPANHIAIAMQGFDESGNAVSSVQLGTYSIASDGSLNTTSTSANMFTAAMDGVTNIKMAPSGNLMAVAGTHGLQLFRFNGANPITHYSGLFTKVQVDAMFWDKANHLYAIGSKVNLLWVFTATLTGYSQAPGSPYLINKPQGLRVLPR